MLGFPGGVLFGMVRHNCIALAYTWEVDRMLDCMLDFWAFFGNCDCFYVVGI